MKPFHCPGSEETLNLGRSLGRLISGGMALALSGDLGSGKTTFVQGLAQGLGLSDRHPVTSPTFTLINEYPIGSITLCHIDLYRLSSVEELFWIGFDDLLGSDRVLAVEWPEILREDGFAFDLDFLFQFEPDSSRTIFGSSSGQAGENLLSRLFLS